MFSTFERPRAESACMVVSVHLDSHLELRSVGGMGLEFAGLGTLASAESQGFLDKALARLMKPRLSMTVSILRVGVCDKT